VVDVVQETRPFFVMPASALKDLREELELIEGTSSAETMERYGYRAGVGLVKTLDIKCTGLKQAEEVLAQIWSETGLSRIQVNLITEREIMVTFQESLESEFGRRCDFTRGYLTGVVSSLLGRTYESTEVSCMSEGAERCVHVLTPGVVYDMPEISLRGPPGDRKYTLEPGNSYLLEVADPSIAYDIFKEQMSEGHKGMIVAREYPEKVQKRWGLDQVPYLWLSYEIQNKYGREPTNVPLIYSEIKNFLGTSTQPVVLISGMEYLISQNNFPKILKLIQLINDNIAMNNGMLLLPVSTETLNPKDVRLLERELRLLDLG
jgi:predicted hydrocarbon binding protein